MILVTAAFPFVPAELNIAHFASTYVPADIEARLLRTLGKDARLVCATDYHSIYASSDGMHTNPDLCQRWHEEYLRLFSLMDIGFDEYITTDDATHREHVAHAFERLTQRGLAYRAQDEDLVCPSCGCHLPQRLAESKGERACPYCPGTQLDLVEEPHYFLKLQGTEEALRTFAQALGQKDVRNLVESYARTPLHDWNFTRHNALGVPAPGEEEQSFYIWFDSLVGYYSLACACEKEEMGADTSPLPPAQEHAPKLDRAIHFIGKNIVYYHSVVWHVLANELWGANVPVDISARGFLDFAKTDDILVDLDELAALYHPDFIRFYLAFKVKDAMADYAFGEKDLVNVANFYCCKKIGGFFYRAWWLAQKATVSLDSIGEEEKGANRAVSRACRPAPYRAEDHQCTDAFISSFGELVEQNRVHDALKLLIAHIDEASSSLSSLEARDLEEPVTLARLLYKAAALQCLLAAYMPALTRKYSIFEHWNPRSIADARLYHLHALKAQKEVVRLHG